MNYVPFDEWLQIQKSVEKDEQKIDAISNVEVLIKMAVDKLHELGYAGVQPVLPVSQTMGVTTLIFDYLNLTNSEAIRLLMIADYITNTEQLPTFRKLAEYKTEEPTRDDVANEGRIIKSLEAHELITINRTSSSRMELETIDLTESGKQQINAFVKDFKFLRKIYNRSRSVAIRKFLVDYLEQSQTESIADFTF